MGTLSPPVERTPRPVRWGPVLLTAVTAVSWAFVGMAGTAALGLHLLGADAVGSLGPMTAAAVVMAVGGSVSPYGDMSVFGVSPAQAQGGIEVMPLGVGLVGALLLGWLFLRPLRRAGTVSAGELGARAGYTAALFLAVLAGLCWAGHDTITIDRSTVGGGAPIEDLPGLGDLPGIGDLGEGLTDLVRNGSSVGFRVNTGASLAGGLVWVLAVLVVALLASRRSPLPPGWDFPHRSVRPAVSALCTVLLAAVAAGVATALWAAATGDQPARIIGGALLGTPNGVWLGASLGLFVPWHGSASGPLAELLPAPMDQLLATRSGEPITVGSLAELDGRMWLLPVAAVLMMLAAGLLTAARTPLRPADPRDPRDLRPARLAAVSAVRLAAASAVVLPLLVWLTGLSVNANLTVFGFDAVGAGMELNGSLPIAFLLGAAWGAAAGFLGGLIAGAAGAAGRLAALPAVAAAPAPAPEAQPAPAAYQRRPYPPAPAPHPHPQQSQQQQPGPYHPRPTYRPDPAEPNPYRDQPPGNRPGRPGTHDAPTLPDTPRPPKPPRPPQDR